MFDVSFFELAVIGLVALLALGPERLPGAARTVGALVRRARTSWFNLRNELERELDAEALKRPFGEAGAEGGQSLDLLSRSLREVSTTLDPKRLSRKTGLLSDAPSTGAAVAAMGLAAEDDRDPANADASYEMLPLITADHPPDAANDADDQR